MEILKATIEDINEISELFNLYRIFYQQPSDLESCRKFIEERMQNQESEIFIARMDGQTVGFTQLYPIFSSVALSKAWLLNDIFVPDQYRKQGIGSALLEEAKKFAKLSGAGWLILQTADDNYTAQIVYEKRGWKRMEDLFYNLQID